MGYKPAPVKFTKKAMWLGLVGYVLLAVIVAVPFV